MKKEFFEEVMQIPSVSKHEDMMQEYILDWAHKHSCTAKKDGKGNVYLKKGSAEFYPVLANHMDTVHSDQEALVDSKTYKTLEWKGDKVTALNPLTNKRTGIGGDDQGGCCIALAVIDRLPAVKAVFVVEEEIGMQGSQAVDKTFFNDAAFIISNDSPDKNRASHSCSGVILYSDDFFKTYLEPICKKHGVTSFRHEPYTDIIQYRKLPMADGKHIECFNFGNGFYDAHCHTEYAQFSDVCAAEELLYDLCTSIPTDRQHTSSEIERKWQPPTYTRYGVAGRASGVHQMSLFDDHDDDYLAHTMFDMATLDIRFDDDAEYTRWQKAIDKNKIVIAVEKDRAMKNLYSAYGELQELQKAFICWCRVFYDDKTVKTWNDIVDAGADDEFNSMLTFDDTAVDDDFPEDDYIDVDIPQTPVQDINPKDENSAFWDFIRSRKHDND